MVKRCIKWSTGKRRSAKGHCKTLRVKTASGRVYTVARRVTAKGKFLKGKC